MGESLDYGFVLELGIYNIVVVFALGGTKEGIINLVKDNTLDGSPVPGMLEVELEDLHKTRAQGVCSYYDDPEVFVVWLKKFDPKDSTDWADIAHELFHLTVLVMNYRDVKFDINNHEAFAYLNGYFHRVVNEKVNEALKLKRDEERGDEEEAEPRISFISAESTGKPGGGLKVEGREITCEHQDQ